MGISSGVNKMELPEHNCLNCEHFCWWDGDYCCSRKMRILQESPAGEFNEDIIKALNDNKDCIDYYEASIPHIRLYIEAFNKFMSNR